MFNFFSKSVDTEEVKEVNKALLKRVKEKDQRIEELEEQIEDQENDTYRSHRLDIQQYENRIVDLENRYERRLEAVRVENRDLADEKIEAAEAKNKAAFLAKDNKIVDQTSEIRTLELKLEEDALDVDLQIQEGINDYKSEHQSEVTALEVKVAKLEGDVKAANAESKSKDQIISVLAAVSDSKGDDIDAMIEFAKTVAPKVNLEKFSINVEVPAPVTVSQKGGDQQQKKQ